jgi:hypothetical protein
MVTMMKNYELFIRDLEGWVDDNPTEGKGWAIEIDPLPPIPGEWSPSNLFTLWLTEEEIETLELEEKVSDWDTVWDRDFTIKLFDFLAQDNVPQRVRDILENLSG